MRTTRRFTTIFAALLSALALATTATAPAYAGGTSAVVVNQRDGSDVYRLMLQIRRAMGNVVDTTNVAAAISSCNSCQTVAVALQGVLVMSDPSVFVPENLALAMNVDCNLCQTLAVADQTLVQTGGPAHLTAAGNQAIAQIRQQLESLRTSNLSIDQIAAQVDQLNQQLQWVLLTDVVPAGPPAGSPAPTDTQTSTTPTDTGTSTTPTDTGTSTTPTDTSTTPTDTTTTPTDTSTTPTDTSTTPTDTSTTPTSTDTSTSTTPTTSP